MLDGANVALPTVGKDLCPICEEAKHETTSDKKKGKGELKSIPADLGCAPITQKPGVPNYTTAAHHLIPANQCLKAFKRLSQMCDAVGYNVNNAQNGMSLPTIGQKEQNVYGGKKYGRLPPEEKLLVAYVVMEETQLQWHVGHHNWKPLNVDTDRFPHVPNYDKLVKRKLRELERNFKEKGDKICKPPKGEPGSQVISKLNSESQAIKGKIAGWDTYFVSALAQQFSVDSKNW